MEPADPLVVLERQGLPEIAALLRRLAQTRPGVRPRDALRADGFGDLIDRLDSLGRHPAAIPAEGPDETS